VTGLSDRRLIASEVLQNPCVYIGLVVSESGF